jgi:hypothetical protein
VISRAFCLVLLLEDYGTLVPNARDAYVFVFRSNLFFITAISRKQLSVLN